MQMGITQRKGLFIPPKASKRSPLAVGQLLVFSLCAHLQVTVSDVPFGWTHYLSEKRVLQLDGAYFQSNVQKNDFQKQIIVPIAQLPETQTLPGASQEGLCQWSSHQASSRGPLAMAGL